MRSSGQSSLGAHRSGCGGRVAPWLVCALLALGVQLGFATSAWGAGTSKIAGTVTEFSTAKAINGIEVCAFAFPEGAETCTKTNASGSYEIAGLSPGKYELFFVDPFESGLDFVAQTSTVTIVSEGSTAEANASLKQGGEISGIVTNAHTGLPIEGVFVCAFPAPIGGGASVECAFTKSKGEYRISGLAEGAYDVDFLGVSGGPLTYLSQYYEDTSSVKMAKAVPVTAGKLVTGINAALLEAGRISGRVVNANTNLPLEGVFVCALLNLQSGVSCAFTEANGQYTISEVPPGQYRVGFALEGYRTQYYNGHSNFEEGQQVKVEAEQTTPSINAAMVPLVKPAPKLLPPPIPVPPVVQTPTPAPQPIKVTVPAKDQLSLGGSNITVQSNGSALVKLRCGGGSSCRGKITLLAKRTTAVKHKRRSSNVSLGTVSFTISGGHTATVKIKLSSLGRSLLGAAHGRLSAALSLVGVDETLPLSGQITGVHLLEQHATSGKR